MGDRKTKPISTADSRRFMDPPDSSVGAAILWRRRRLSRSRWGNIDGRLCSGMTSFIAPLGKRFRGALQGPGRRDGPRPRAAPAISLTRRAPVSAPAVARAETETILLRQGAAPAPAPAGMSYTRPSNGHWGKGMKRRVVVALTGLSVGLLCAIA